MGAEQTKADGSSNSVVSCGNGCGCQKFTCVTGKTG